LTIDTEVELTWKGGERFAATAGSGELTIDGDRQAGPSPVQTLAVALAGCMAIDVVAILEKGRLPLQGLTAHLEAERHPKPTRSLSRVRLHFRVTGDLPGDRVERAIALSRDTYCSVWHSLNPSIAFETSFEVASGA